MLEENDRCVLDGIGHILTNIELSMGIITALFTSG